MPRRYSRRRSTRSSSRPPLGRAAREEHGLPATDVGRRPSRRGGLLPSLRSASGRRALHRRRDRSARPAFRVRSQQRRIAGSCIWKNRRYAGTCKATAWRMTVRAGVAPAGSPGDVSLDGRGSSSTLLPWACYPDCLCRAEFVERCIRCAPSRLGEHCTHSTTRCTGSRGR